jgi:hypothetical protein
MNRNRSAMDRDCRRLHIDKPEFVAEEMFSTLLFGPGRLAQHVNDAKNSRETQQEMT